MRREFDVHAIGDGARPRGRLCVNEFGAANYDIDGRVVCVAASGNGVVVAATRPENDTAVRVVFLAVRDLDGANLGLDTAAPAFSVVAADQSLGSLCENAMFLLGAAEPLDSGGVTVQDR